MKRWEVSSWRRILRVSLIVAAGIIIVSCSEKSTRDREGNSSTPEATRAPAAEVAEAEDERQPREDEIAEDCVSFVRSTKVVSTKALAADCPGCPAGGTEMFAFRQMKTERVSCAGDTCTVLVTLVVVFNPGAGEAIAGGLTAWISPEQRSEYLSGKTPPGEQSYRVKITYKRRGAGWRAAEFDRE